VLAWLISLRGRVAASNSIFQRTFPGLTGSLGDGDEGSLGLGDGSSLGGEMIAGLKEGSSTVSTRTGEDAIGCNSSYCRKRDRCLSMALLRAL
jgi:hypothetical protein